MRIAIASCGLGHITRGIESWAHDLAYALHARHHQVILCKGAGTPDSVLERVIPCCHRESRRTGRFFNRLPTRGLWRIGLSSTYDLEAMTFGWNLLKVLRRERIDILHVQDPTVALLVQRARRIGLVKTRAILGHGTNEPHSFLKKIEYLHHGASFQLEEARAAGCYRSSWCAIPNFIETDTFRPGCRDSMRDELGIPKDAVVVLCAAAIKRNHKRVDYLLNEFARTRADHPELPIWLILAGGAESGSEELLDFGRRLIGERLRPLVNFPRTRMPDLYRAADLFTLCSLREMMPLAMLEATASGLPCIIHEHPSVQWIAGDGGFAIDMSREGTLAGAIGTLASDVPLRHHLGDRARRNCLANFSPDHVIQQILGYYRFVLAAGAGAKRESVPSLAPTTGGPAWSLNESSSF